MDDTWQELRERVHSRLEAYIQAAPGCPPRLQEAMAYSLLAGGKRLRPLLVCAACEACGGDVAHALPAACALEMVHTYSLVHDDLPAMDDDDLRRGRPTNHVIFGEALAILAGDGLLTLAFEVLARDVQPASVAAACCVDLARAAGATGMVGGQVVDLESEGQAIDDVAVLEGIHRRKTGALYHCALSLGARIAGASDRRREDLGRYGDCLGLAFQITDDLLDVCGSHHVTGKAVNKDAGLGKLTYPALLGVETSRARARELIEEARALVAPLGIQGRKLDALARFVLERDH